MALVSEPFQHAGGTGRQGLAYVRLVIAQNKIDIRRGEYNWSFFVDHGHTLKDLILPHCLHLHAYLTPVCTHPGLHPNSPSPSMYFFSIPRPAPQIHLIELPSVISFSRLVQIQTCGHTPDTSTGLGTSRCIRLTVFDWRYILDMRFCGRVAKACVGHSCTSWILLGAVIIRPLRLSEREYLVEHGIVPLRGVVRPQPKNTGLNDFGRLWTRYARACKQGQYDEHAFQDVILA